jgi:succinylarginine dihydrolase
MNSLANEINFDGIVGPTHNYSGLSYGNVASIENQLIPSNPREAALQGLEKMKFLAGLGLKQAVLPPHERPHLPTLRALGFQGSDAAVLSSAQQLAPHLLTACSSAAAMWTANAATITPSSDSVDRHVHITPANLSAKFHRSIEPAFTSLVLQKIFKDPLYFTVHPPLPPGHYFSDEGAANHCRFCRHYHDPGIHLFVYGRFAFAPNPLAPKRFPARQTFEASQAISRLHQLYPQRLLFAQQNPHAIDAGVFHNDVASVNNGPVFFCHEQAFVATDHICEEINKQLIELTDTPLKLILVPEKRVSIEEAVKSYLFNSQLITLPDGSMALIAPTDCQDVPSVQEMLNDIIYDQDNPIKEVHFIDLRQSMRNGGGPACLRLRAVLNSQEITALHQGVLWSDRLYIKLADWVKKHYSDRLLPQEVADPKLLQETQQALEELTKILGLGSIYSFQKP